MTNVPIDIFKPCLRTLMFDSLARVGDVGVTGGSAGSTQCVSQIAVSMNKETYPQTMGSMASWPEGSARARH